MEKKTIVLITGIVLFLALTVYGAVLYIDSKDKVSNQNFDKVAQKTSDGTYQLKSEAATQTGNVKPVMQVRDVETIYKDIHLMTNSIVIAEEIWGETKITEEKINALLLEVMNSDYSDKNRLIDILTRWKNGDFSLAAEDHNYVWDRLEGTVGIAYKVNWNKVPAWAKKK